MARESLVMALRVARPEDVPEAEPVVVEHEGAEVVLRLDDGEELRLDWRELAATRGPA